MNLRERKIYTGKVPEYIYQCGEDSGEEPPVLIPNTEVKLTSAENTLLETTREHRDLPHTRRKESTQERVFSFFVREKSACSSRTGAVVKG